MDVLKQARHRAGMNFAVLRVFLPCIMLLALCMLALLLLGMFQVPPEAAPFILYLMLALFAAMLIATPASYFVRRRQPKAIRQELHDVIRTERILGQISQERLDRLEKRKAEFAAQSESFVATSVAQVQEKIREDVRAPYAKMIAALRARLAEVGAKKRIRKQSEFLELEGQLRNCEAAVEKMGAAAEKHLDAGSLARQLREVQAGTLRFFEQRAEECRREVDDAKMRRREAFCALRKIAQK